MSGVMHLLDEEESKVSAALGVLVSAKLLKHCRNHNVYSRLSGPVDKAYKFGNAIWTREESSSEEFGLPSIYDSRKEMAEYIKHALENEELVYDRCETCHQLLSD